MPENNMTSLMTNSLLIGLVLLGCISFFAIFANNEGKADIFIDYPDIDLLQGNFSDIYTDGQLIDTSNINSNISANYNPELAISAADQSGNAIQINTQNIVTGVWQILALMINFLLGSIVGRIISGLLISLVGFYATYYFIKYIRTGT